MQVPMAMRHIKPGAAHLAADYHKSKWIISCMPDSLPRMRVWLCAVLYARRMAGPDFAEGEEARARLVEQRQSIVKALAKKAVE
jgi:hypothetical protein